jgi:hypothetical protein
MGLSVVHGIIGTYGGAITAYSEPGQGSTFRVYLPIMERRKEPRAEAEESIPTGSECILSFDTQWKNRLYSRKKSKFLTGFGRIRNSFAKAGRATN